MLLDRIVTKCVFQRNAVPGVRVVFMPSTGTSVSSSSSTHTRYGKVTWMNHNRYSRRYKSSIPADTLVSTTATTRTAHVLSSPKNTTSSSASSSSSSSTTTSYIAGIVAALFAATAGVVTVSGVAQMVERNTASQVPKFDVQQERFDTTTYMGRFYHMLLQCDPYLLSYSHQQVMDAKHFVDTYVAKLQQQEQQQRQFEAMHRDHSEVVFHNETSTSDHNDEENDKDEYDVTFHHQLWEAKRIYESAMNDSGAIVPRPFRMSGYVPYNGPICVMMISSTTTTAILLWSWINQSQNAFVNYYNRSNSSQPINMYTFLQSYTIAVSSALCVAFGLATFIQKRYTPQKAQLLLRYVAFPSAVVASSLNCYIVRSPEISTGIPLCDEHGKNVMEVATTVAYQTDKSMDETALDSPTDMIPASTDDAASAPMTSKIAATRGVYATTASRALLQAPVYFLPPLLMSVFCSPKLLASPTKLLPITTYLLLCSFGFGLPAACAIFPQTSSISASEVEPHFQALINPKTQQPYKVFYYDKGL